MNKIDNLIAGIPFINHKNNRLVEEEQSLDQTQIKKNATDNYHFSVTDHAALGMKVVFQSVSSKFSSSEYFANRPLNNPFDSKVKTTQTETTQPSIFDFEKVAQTVTNFVSAGMQAAKESGASNKELEEMLLQARSGANQGFDEALEELEDLSLLTDELTTGIEKSRDLITQGLDNLAAQYSDSKFPENNEDTVKLEAVSQTSNKLSSSYSKSSDLTITTAEGDKVNISFNDNRSQVYGERYSETINNNAIKANYQSTSTNYREVNFSYTIEGDLNDEEKAAIGALIEDVNKLQKDFFNGDIEKAYQQVLQLGFDDQQLSSISLDLQQQTSMASQSYTEVANYQENALEQLKAQLAPILDFVEQFKDLKKAADEVLENNNKFDQGQLNQLMQSVFNAEFGKSDDQQERFNQFMTKLI